MEGKGFTVIEGGKSNNPGAVHSASRTDRALPEGLPPGFKLGTHKAEAGGIPAIDKDGNEGELIALPMGKMPPELLLMLLLAMHARSK